MLGTIFKERCSGQDPQCFCLTESLLKIKYPIHIQNSFERYFFFNPYLVALDFQISQGENTSKICQHRKFLGSYLQFYQTKHTGTTQV